MLPLRELPDYPAPAGAEVAEVLTRDGVPIRAAAWRPAGPARATVLLLQGRAEFIEKYYEVVGELLARGCAVATFDWRGQGGSARALAARHHGHVRRFEDFRHDYEAVRDRFVGPAASGPVHVLAHSMGACIALTGALDGWLGADRLVAVSPMIDISLVRRGRLVRALARGLSRLGAAGRMVPGGQIRSISTLPFAGNRLGTDPVRYARNAALARALGWAAVGSPTIGWLAAAYAAMDRLAAPAPPIGLPTLVVAAEDDPVCSTPAIRLFARRLARGRIVVLPGARHEILMEADAIRARFWSEFDAFVADPPAATEVARPGTDVSPRGA